MLLCMYMQCPRLINVCSQHLVNNCVLLYVVWNSASAIKDLNLRAITGTAVVKTPLGYTPLSVLAFHSLDTNECANNNGNCEQLCNNTKGSFTCSCQSGYILNVDQRTCDG